MLRWSRELELDNPVPCEENRSGVSQHELAGIRAHQPPTPPPALGPRWSLCPEAFCPGFYLLMSAEISLPNIEGWGQDTPHTQDCLFDHLHLGSFAFGWGMQCSSFTGTQRKPDEVFYPQLLHQKYTKDNLIGEQAAH